MALLDCVAAIQPLGAKHWAAVVVMYSGCVKVMYRLKETINHCELNLAGRLMFDNQHAAQQARAYPS